MRDSARFMKAQEVAILCDQNVPDRGREAQLFVVGCTQETRRDGIGDFDLAPAQTRGYGGRDVLVQVIPDSQDYEASLNGGRFNFASTAEGVSRRNSSTSSRSARISS